MPCGHQLILILVYGATMEDARPQARVRVARSRRGKPFSLLRPNACCKHCATSHYVTVACCPAGIPYPAGTKKAVH